MTTWEQMCSGQLYDANAPELVASRAAAKELCYDFNALRPKDTAAQRALLEALLGHVGGDVQILSPFWCDYGKNIFLGDGFFANHGLVILDCAPVRFGDHVLIGPDCGFYTAGHPLDAGTRNRGLEYAKPITVGDSVWFGGGVRVMPGVTIGDGAVIGGGSVVTKDIPAGVIAVGNPCRVLRPITKADREVPPCP